MDLKNNNIKHQIFLRCLFLVLLLSTLNLPFYPQSAINDCQQKILIQSAKGPQTEINAFKLRNELKLFASSNAQSDWSRLWEMLPDSLDQNIYKTLSLLMDSLEAVNKMIHDSSQDWVRWALVRAGIAVRARDYSTAASYFRTARNKISFKTDEQLWLTLAEREIGCLEKGEYYEKLLATIEDVMPYFPLGQQHILEGWCARLRFKLNKLKWEVIKEGSFISRNYTSDMYSDEYLFITISGDTLTLCLTPATLLRHGRDIWTPGGLGFVFDVNQAQVLEGTRQAKFDIIGKWAKVYLTGKYEIVLAEFCD